MRCCSLRRALAMIVAVAIVGAFPVSPGQAAPAARLLGKVLDADGMTPLSGVVVNLLDAKSSMTFPSQPTNERGVFEATAPAGTYRIVADTPRGAYLASGSVKLRDGSNSPLSLTLKQSAPEDAGSPPPSSSSGKGELRPWVKWTIVGGIVVGGLLVIDSVTSDESSASGF